MKIDQLEGGLRELVEELKQDHFLSTFNCVADAIEEAHSQEEALDDAIYNLLVLCQEAATWGRKLAEYRTARYGVGP
jgi:hypothetical protein